MFYYISFLRPPPLQASLSGSISITPQVANDLRTELLTDEQEIFYAWSYVSTSQDQLNRLPIISKPQKLTIWRQSSAYKDISVPFPPSIREGQYCRLILSSHAERAPHVIDLSAPALGERPLPVVSLPTLFSSRSAKGKARTTTIEKQEQVERIYMVSLNSEREIFLTIREQTSFDLDKKVWDSGIGLSSWIVALAQDAPSSRANFLLIKLKDALFSCMCRNILELGAGTGIVSLTLGCLLSKAESSGGGCIITTDLPSAMPLLEHNITANKAVFQSPWTCPQAVVLDWDAEKFPEEVSAVRDGFHVIVMADVTYNTSSFPSLINTLSKLVSIRSSNVESDSRSPLILLAYKERDPAERSLWDMAREVGIIFEKVGERCGAGGDPVEIWIGQVL